MLNSKFVIYFITINNFKTSQHFFEIWLKLWGGGVLENIESHLPNPAHDLRH